LPALSTIPSFADGRENTMRIAVVNTQAPFVSGGAEEHARRLCEELRAAGHQVELVAIPFNWNSPDSILDHAVAAASLDIGSFFGQSVDLMIGLRFPAYLVQHPNKVIWLIHQYRDAYDLWEAGRSGLRHCEKGNLVRQIIHDMDTKALSEAKLLYANSRNVSERLRRFNGLAADPLYHPPPLATQLRTGEFGDYFYFPSRISGLKRQGLVLEALSYTKTPAKLIFSGSPDSSNDGEAFRRRVKELNLEDRVEWYGFVSAEQMIELFAGARAVIFPPFDEDLGYVTLEAMIAGKPVITTTDSGGPSEFIDHNKEGLVVKPDARSLAKAIDLLQQDPALALRLGGAARQRFLKLSLSWENVIQKLTRPDLT
jgi:glycosyltransferase involved in cell wall biosynthesis